MDPLWEQYRSYNPYHYSKNNVLRLIDPNGAKTGDVVVAFGGADVFNEDDPKVAGDIIETIKKDHIDQNGGAARAFESEWWGTDPEDGTTFNKVEEAFNYIKANYNKDKNGNEVEGGRVIIYGYSYGGVHATHLVNRLDTEGIKVALLVTVDAAEGPENSEVQRMINANVQVNLNYFQLDPDLTGSHGGVNMPLLESHTTVVNSLIPGYGHGEIDEFTQPYVESTINYVLNIGSTP